MLKLPTALRFAGNLVTAWAHKVVSLAVSLVVTAIAVRQFGLEQMALLILATQVSSYAALLELGIPTSMSRQLPQHLSSGDFGYVTKLCSTCLVYLIAAGLLLGFLSPFFAYGLTHLFQIDESLHSLAIVLFAISLLGTAIGLPLRIGSGLLFSGHKFSEYFLIETISTLLRLVAVVVAVYFFNAPVWVYAIIVVLSVLPGSFVEFVIGSRSLPQCRLRRSEFSPATFKTVFSLGAASLTGTFSVTLALQAGSLILAVILPPTAVMVFALPLIISTNAMAFAAAFSGVLSPIASQLRDTDTKRIFAIARISTKYALAIAFFVVVMAIVAGREFIRLWLGDDAVRGATLDQMYSVLITLTVGLAVAIVGSPSRGALFSLGDHWKVALTELPFGVAGLVFGLIFGAIAKNYPLAMALSIACFVGLRGWVLYTYLAKRLGLRADIGIFGNALVPAALSLVALKSFQVATAIDGPYSVIVSTILVAVVYVVVAFFWVFEKAHRSKISLALRTRFSSHHR